MNLASSAGSILPGRGLINPAFVIKIVPATDALQEPVSAGRENPNNDLLDNLEVGTEVEAKVGKTSIAGRVQRVIKNGIGDGVYVIVRDAKGKDHKIEGGLISVVGADKPNPERERLISSPGIFNETQVLSFEEFSSM